VTTAAGMAATASYSPARRVPAVQRTIEDSMKINDRTRRTVSELSDKSQRDFQEAYDQDDALFNLMTKAGRAQSSIDDSSFAQRHLIPTFSFQHAGKTVALKQLEKETKKYREDVINTSLKARTRKEEEAAAALEAERQKQLAEALLRQQQQQQSHTFPPATSYDVDLEAGLVDC